MGRFDYPDEVWDAAKAEARGLMIGRAKVGKLISYSDLAAGLTVIEVGAHDPRLTGLLEDIILEEMSAGRPALTAVVVHKQDKRPGQGFYDVMRQNGRDVRDEMAVWVGEINRLKAFWSDPRNSARA